MTTTPATTREWRLTSRPTGTRPSMTSTWSRWSLPTGISAEPGSEQPPVVDGLDHAVDAFLGLFEGDNIGKMLVRDGAGDDPSVAIVA